MSESVSYFKFTTQLFISFILGIKEEIVEYKELSEHILDVAYYLRRFKFSGYDPRFLRAPGDGRRGFFMEFPSPPLKTTHWEVKKNCESSFVECIKYLQETVSRTILPRQLDSLTVTKLNGWSFTEDEEDVERANKECFSLLEQDDKSFAQFSDPVQKFEWLASASYYTCMYTLMETNHLKFFTDDCDNFASCIPWDLGPHNKDIRSDNLNPFACALYSFCPDPCCPLKHLRNPSDCFSLSPCSGSTGSDRNCWIPLKKNLNFESLVLNEWNVSCSCDGVGTRWDSVSGDEKLHQLYILLHVYFFHTHDNLEDGISRSSLTMR
ncbi:hypothetical protein RUM43_000009 [Polyplax serrata]|uniref:Uncharacterized protein n=1 Tax=Polyplax serrata TaxID=468196 RepID=A0AAN8SDB7_POLSC